MWLASSSGIVSSDSSPLPLSLVTCTSPVIVLAEASTPPVLEARVSEPLIVLFAQAPLSSLSEPVST